MLHILSWIAAVYVVAIGLMMLCAWVSLHRCAWCSFVSGFDGHNYYGAPYAFWRRGGHPSCWRCKREIDSRLDQAVQIGAARRSPLTKEWK